MKYNGKLIRCRVSCNGHHHYIRITESGRIILENHDIKKERALKRLGINSCNCLRIFDILVDRLGKIRTDDLHFWPGELPSSLDRYIDNAARIAISRKQLSKYIYPQSSTETERLVVRKRNIAEKIAARLAQKLKLEIDTYFDASIINKVKYTLNDGLVFHNDYSDTVSIAKGREYDSANLYLSTGVDNILLTAINKIPVRLGDYFIIGVAHVFSDRSLVIQAIHKDDIQKMILPYRKYGNDESAVKYLLVNHGVYEEDNTLTKHKTCSSLPVD